VPPKVSLPSGRSASGSNRVEGEDEARSVGGPTASGTTYPNNNPTRQQSARATRSAAASTDAWSTSVPSARGDITGQNSAWGSASERPQSVMPGDARGTAGARPAATSPRGDDPPTPRSPVPGPRQSAWGTRGTASRPTPTVSAMGRAPSSSQWPTPGQPHLASNTRSPASAWTLSSTRSDRSAGPDADAAPWSRQGNGRQRDRGRESTSASSSTLSDHRSTGGPGSRSPIFRPVDGGFPTFADTPWGDPIAVAQSSRKSKKSTPGTSSATSLSAVGDDIADGQASGDNAEAGQEQETTGQNDRTSRGRRGNRRGGRGGTPRRTVTSPPATSSTSQEVAPPNVLDVTLPPAGPGSQWCDENAEW
jgi:hypothetical protein